MTTANSGSGATTERGLVFGSAAEDYERYRRGYGEEVLALVRDYAAGPVRTAVEVGAGTGKATRLFAGAGVGVTALEPDPQMAQVLRRTTTGLPVTVIASTFEQFETRERFDLVYAAAAWHWTDPATRWARAWDLLRPGGVLALFGGPSGLVDQALSERVEKIESELFGEPGRVPGHPWSEDQARADGHLVDVTTSSVPGAIHVTARDYLGRLGTVSAYLSLDEIQRRDALGRVGAILPARVEIDTTVRLLLARRPVSS